MRLIANSCSFLFFGILSIAITADEPLRLDGASEETFARSFSKMVEILDESERWEFRGALLDVLYGKECLSSGSITDLTFVPVRPEDGSELSTCREQLHGLSQKDIFDESRSLRARSR